MGTNSSLSARISRSNLLRYTLGVTAAALASENKSLASAVDDLGSRIGQVNTRYAQATAEREEMRLIREQLAELAPPRAD